MKKVNFFNDTTCQFRSNSFVKPTVAKNIVNKEGVMGIYSVIIIINEAIDSAFMCAIISAYKNTIFIKLSLRPKGITEVEDDFIAFCSSLNIANY